MRLVTILEAKLNTKQLALLVQQAVAAHTDYELELTDHDGFIVGQVVGLSDENDRVLFLSPQKIAVCHIQDFDSIIAGGPADLYWPDEADIEAWADTFVKDWLY